MFRTIKFSGLDDFDTWVRAQNVDSIHIINAFAHGMVIVVVYVDEASTAVVLAPVGVKSVESSHGMTGSNIPKGGEVVTATGNSIAAPVKSEPVQPGSGPVPPLGGKTPAQITAEKKFDQYKARKAYASLTEEERKDTVYPTWDGITSLESGEAKTKSDTLETRPASK